MKKFFLLLAFLAIPAAAAELPAVEIVNLAAFKAAALGAYVHLQGIVKPGDGLDAYYTQNGFVCTPDDFSIIKDKAGHCYFRGVTASQSIPQFASVAAIQALSASQPAEVETVSYYAANNLGGARYSWNAASTTNDCAHVQVTGVPTGRYVLRADLTNDAFIPAQCGAYFDNSHDDIVAWQASETIANAYNWVIACEPGISKLANDYIHGLPGVVHQGCGETRETINQTNPNVPAYYMQAATVGGLIKAPEFYGMTIICPAASNSYSCLQFNSISGGFVDGSGQAYLWRPIVRNVEISGGGTKGGNTFYPGSTTGQTVGGLQCSKCFEGEFDNNYVHDGQGYGFDIEGSDFMHINHNRTFGNGGIPIALVAQGQFCNYDQVDHNDVLFPSPNVDSYIYSSCKEAQITFNGLEGAQTPVSQIHIAGGLFVEVGNNGTYDTSGGPSFKVDGDNYFKLNIHDNATAATSKGASFNGGSGALVYVQSNATRAIQTHYGNGSEDGFPFNVQSSPAAPIGNTLMDITPNSYQTVVWANYGPSLRVQGGGLLTAQAPAWVLPALSGTTGLITFPDQNPVNVTGTISVCFKGISGNPAQVINVQLLSGGAAVATATQTMTGGSAGQFYYCPAALQHLTIGGAAGVNFWNSDTTHGANVFLFEVIINNG